MKVETYVKRNNVKEFWLQSKENFVLMQSGNVDDMHHFGHRQIKNIEEVEGETVTLYI